jgi:hypothetical protein
MSDFSPPDLGEEIYVFLRNPTFWSCVTAALGNEHKERDVA